MTAADILDGLLRMNLAAGAAILAVVALRKLVRPRFGARLAYGLWLLPVLTSAAVLIPARQVHVVRAIAPVLQGAAHIRQGVLSAHAAAVTSLDPLVLLVGLWLAGALGAALVMAHLQLRFLSRARGGDAGPALVGVMVPRIVTPWDFAERYSQGEQALVLAHERAHLARQDSRLNGLTAVAQCLCWFNPLVHLAAHLMRVDQELACDETVVTRFPEARRAYAEVLVKTQLTTLPLPLGCYWPAKSEHPLVERITMLKRKGVSRARRSAGAAALAVLCAGAGAAAWASQPPDVRISISRADEARAARLAQPRVVAPRPQRVARLGGPGVQRPGEGDATTNPAISLAGDAPLDQTPAEAPPPDKALAATSAGTIADAQPPPVTSARQVATLPSSAPQPTPAPASSETGEANCYPVFGELRCNRVTASPARATSRPEAAGPPIVAAALANPASGGSSATSRPPAAVPARVNAAYQVAASPDLDRVVCETAPVTGSRFKRRICMTKADWKWRQSLALSLERFWGLDPSGSTASYD